VCKKNVCGDGVKGPGETCDDGNTISADGCNAICQLELTCGGKLYQCGNGFDDDNDGKIDLKDPECTSPCDDDEGSFQTKLPGQNKDCKADCYFDANSGGGDDKCEWNLKCDPQNPGKDVGCAYDPNLKMCSLMMPPACLDFCVPLVPNGCDCFGCCQIGEKFVYLDSNPQCNINNLDACNACTFFPSCNNPCMPDKCEICFGQDEDDLPPECGGQPTCEGDLKPCTDSSQCMLGEFCQTGCCVDVIPQ
jgi:cysteine-rich repeat protein